jgi:hypothetical protein
MTTIADVKRLVQPVLERNPDLALVGRLLVVKPVRHLLRGVYIDRSLDPSIFTPTWAAIFLFEPTDSFTFNWGDRLYRTSHGPWDVNNPKTQAAMVEEIEGTALPILRPIESLDDFVTFTSRGRFPSKALEGYHLRKIVVDVARGDLDSARAICAELIGGRTRWSWSPRMREDFERITNTLCPLIGANDKPALATLLHEWEAHSVEKLKIGQLWQRTPFPLEEGRVA